MNRIRLLAVIEEANEFLLKTICLQRMMLEALREEETQPTYADCLDTFIRSTRSYEEGFDGRQRMMKLTFDAMRASLESEAKR